MLLGKLLQTFSKGGVFQASEDGKYKLQISTDFTENHRREKKQYAIAGLSIYYTLLNKYQELWGASRTKISLKKPGTQIKSSSQYVKSARESWNMLDNNDLQDYSLSSIGYKSLIVAVDSEGFRGMIRSILSIEIPKEGVDKQELFNTEIPLPPGVFVD